VSFDDGSVLLDSDLKRELDKRGWVNNKQRYRYFAHKGLCFKCGSCGEYLPVKEFSRDKKRINGHRTNCASCRTLRRNGGLVKKSLCPRGHDCWTSGTFYFSEGERKCLQCRRDADREWLIANPACTV